MIYLLTIELGDSCFVLGLFTSTMEAQAALEAKLGYHLAWTASANGLQSAECEDLQGSQAFIEPMTANQFESDVFARWQHMSRKTR